MRKLRTTLGIAAIAGFAVTGAGMGSAHAESGTGPTTPHIVGGVKATSGYTVQLIFKQGAGTYGCTGEALSNDWILTARHCVDGISWMNVYYSNDTKNRGTAYAADKVSSSPYGDVGLVHLKSSKTLSSYAKLADSYTTKKGDKGVISGYGGRANMAAADHLYKADVEVLSKGDDAYGGDGIRIKGVTGAANHGDSGGPLVIGGKIVGICSHGDDEDPGANTKATSYYANITGHRSWITEKTGV